MMSPLPKPVTKCGDPPTERTSPILPRPPREPPTTPMRLLPRIPSIGIAWNHQRRRGKLPALRGSRCHHARCTGHDGGSVSDVTATATAPNAINLSWQDNSDNTTGFLIDVYTTELTDPNNADASNFPQVLSLQSTVSVAADTTSDSLTLTPSFDLPGAADYVFEVSAQNAAGTSPASAPSSPVQTPPDPSVTPPVTPQITVSGSGNEAVIDTTNFVNSGTAQSRVQAGPK